MACSDSFVRHIVIFADVVCRGGDAEVRLHSRGAATRLSMALHVSLISLQTPLVRLLSESFAGSRSDSSKQAVSFRRRYGLSLCSVAFADEYFCSSMRSRDLPTSMRSTGIKGRTLLLFPEKALGGQCISDLSSPIWLIFGEQDERKLSGRIGGHHPVPATSTRYAHFAGDVLLREKACG